MPALGHQARVDSFYAPLVEISNALGSALKLDDLLALILDLALGQLQANQGSILMHDLETDRLQMLAAVGLPQEVVAQGYLPRRGSIAEYVLENSEPLLLQNGVEEDDRFTSIANKRNIKSSMCVPMHSEGRVIGTLNISRTNAEKHFSPDDLDFCSILASHAAVSIERARLHERLLESAQLAAVGQTVSSISHCIKNMLTPLKGGESICRMGLDSNNMELIEKGCILLKRNIDRISLLVLDMLDYSKERKPLISRFEIEPLADEVFESVHLRDEKNPVEMRFANPTGPKEVCADRDQIFRALLNLVGNAYEAMDGSQGLIEVQVDAFAAGDEANAEFTLPDYPRTIRLRVADNGKGLETDNSSEIFTPFYSTKGTKGTGLGLAATQKIVTEHGGAIRVESAKGQGTTFTILLPEIND